MHKTNRGLYEVFLPLATKPAELNMHSTGTEAADEDKCSRSNMECKLCSSS